MIAEYTAVAGAPLPSTPWPLVLDIAQRAAQFEARRFLTSFGAVQSAVNAAFGSDEGAQEREKMQAIAYPSAKPPARTVPNIWAEGEE